MADSEKPEDKDVIQETADVVEAEIIEESIAEVETVVDDEPVQKRGIFGPMFLGGVVAAVLGFGASQYAQTSGWPFPQDNSELEALARLVEVQKSQMDELQDEIAGLQAELSKFLVQEDLTTIGDRQSETDSSVAGLSDRLDQAVRRLTDIENRPIPEVGATVEAVQTYERELAAMRQMFEEELKRIDAAQKQSAAAGKATTEQANNALERASLARINAAIESGASFEDAIAVLVSTGISVPDALIATAESGVPTLGELRDEFPEAAREALRASATPDPEAGNISRLGALLKSQLGARSLEPHEGDDADAVLSRAEGALREGDLEVAISELGGLSEPATAHMTAWIERANIRITSVTSVTALNAELNE